MSEVSNKEIGFIIALILIVLLGIFFFPTNFQSTQENVIEENIPSENNKIPEVEEIISFTYIQAVQSGDVNNCDYLENIGEKSACINKLSSCDDDQCKYDSAIQKRSEAECFELENSSLVSKCTFEVFRQNTFESAVRDDSTDSCSVLDEPILKQRCIDNYYFVSSVNKNDKSFCDLIVQEDLRNECY